MGETANKMSRSERERRVYELRDEIAHKRQELTAEISELKRRREEAVVVGRKAAKIAGIAAVGAIITGSLLGAVIDLFSSERQAPAEVIPPVAQPQQQQTSVSTLGSTLMDILVDALRFAAMHYVRNKVSELQTTMAAQQYSLHE